MSAGRPTVRAWPIVAILALAWLALFPITSVDAYYHVAAGKWMLDNGRIPDRAIFSATFGDRPWHDNEWGFQVVAGLLGRTEVDEAGAVVLTPLGRAALIGSRALCLALALALLSAQMARAGVASLTRAVALVLAAFLTFNNLFWAVRPQILTYVALAAVAYLLERDRGGDRRAVWLALPVVALWANVHGAFIVGIALLGCEAAGSLLDRDGRFKRLALVAALSPLAACLNPHGVAQVVHPFLYMTQPEIHAGNAEWTRPDFLHLPLFNLTLVATAWVLWRSPRRRFADLLRVGAFFVLLTTAIRHLPLAAIVVTPVLAEHVTALARRSRPLGRFVAADDAGRPPLTVRKLGTAVVAIVVIVSLSGARFVGPVPSFTERMVRPMPEAEVRWALRHQVPGTVFNAYRFGAFLMLRLYPRERIFMDGRNDVYGTFRHDVFNHVRLARPGWEKIWDRIVVDHSIGWVLLDASDPLVARLATDRRFERVVVDKTDGRSDEIALFVRGLEPHHVPAAADVAGSPGDGEIR